MRSASFWSFLPHIKDLRDGLVSDPMLGWRFIIRLSEASVRTRSLMGCIIDWETFSVTVGEARSYLIISMDTQLCGEHDDLLRRSHPTQ